MLRGHAEPREHVQRDLLGRVEVASREDVQDDVVVLGEGQEVGGEHLGETGVNRAREQVAAAAVLKALRDTGGSYRVGQGLRPVVLLGEALIVLRNLFGMSGHRLDWLDACFQRIQLPRLFDKPLEDVREFCGIAATEQETVETVLNDLGKPADVACDDRDLCGQGLQGDQPEALLHRRNDQRVDE
ncbi:hypothetical protein D3C87_1400830 [compost metagenome]